MTKASILVVDDKESVLEVMSSILGEAHDVTVASDPAVAVELIGQRRFDVVLTDVRMPGASGFDVLEAVKSSECGATVVLMTGFASIPDAVAAIRKGAFDYVAKPLEADEVSLVVARALEHRAGAHTAPEQEAVASDFRDAMAAARDRASRDYIVALMRQFHGNVTRAATKAGLTRESLHRLLRKYGVRSEEFKPPA